MLFLGLRSLVEGDDGRVTLLHSGNQVFAQNLSHPVSLITMTFNIWASCPLITAVNEIHWACFTVPLQVYRFEAT